MSPFVAWLRQTFAWSNTRQAWEERLALFFLAAAAVAAAVWGGRLALSQQVLLWSAWLVFVALLLRRGWLRLFGPVLFYDLVRVARRSRYILLRCLYAVILSLLLCWVYLIWYMDSPDGGIEAHKLSRFAESFFYTFMSIQFLTVVVLTPAYTAGAIAEEKDRKTLEFILATDLANREIVLSKLASRVANLTLLVLAGLPVLSALQFLGGVDPNLVLAGFAATGLTMASLAGLSILNSVWCKRTRDALAITYLTAGAYLVVALIGWIMVILPIGVGTWPSASSPITVGDVVNWLNTGNILTAVFDLGRGVTGGLHMEDVLPARLRDYALFHGLIAAVCSTWAVVRLRVLALREGQVKVKKKGEPAARFRWRPRIGAKPMVWKELFAEPGFRFNLFGRFVVLVFVIATFVPAGIIIAVFLDEVFRFGYMSRGGMIGNPVEFLSDGMYYWVRWVGSIVACLLLLGVAARASSCVSTERDRQTLDALYTSPLSSDDILFGKWLGCVLSVRWGAVWLGLIWALAIVTGGIHPLAVAFVFSAWLVYAAFVACLGLWFSVVSRTTLRATLWTLLATAGLGVGHWIIWMCCIPVFTIGPATPSQEFQKTLEWAARTQVGLTPPLALGWYLPFRTSDFSKMNWSRKEVYEVVLGTAGVLFWMAMAAVLWFAVSKRFRVLSGRLPYQPARAVAPPTVATVRPLDARAPARGREQIAEK